MRGCSLAPHSSKGDKFKISSILFSWKSVVSLLNYYNYNYLIKICISGFVSGSLIELKHEAADACYEMTFSRSSEVS